jgi:hypothetical protein
MKALQELVPNSNKTDKASMLDEIIDYVKFLQLQVKVSPETPLYTPLVAGSIRRYRLTWWHICCLADVDICLCISCL